jgi:hypothetical protein
VASRAHVLHVNYRLGQNFALDVEVEVVNVGIANTLRHDDSGVKCQVRVARIPAIDIACVLRLRGGTHIPRVGARTREHRSHGRILVAVAVRWSAGAGGWPVDDIGALLRNPADYLIKRIVRQVPARVRERVVQRALVRYAKAATQ